MTLEEEYRLSCYEELTTTWKSQSYIFNQTQVVW